MFVQGLLTMAVVVILHVRDVTGNPACSAEWCDPSHEPYANIVSVMTGYHIIKGNPFTRGSTHDPGFATAYIFVPTEKNAQDRYQLVSGITARAVVRCSLSMSTDTISTVEGFKETIINKIAEESGFTSNLETEVKAKIEGVGISTTVPPVVDAAFSSSKEFRDNTEFLTVKQGNL